MSGGGGIIIIRGKNAAGQHSDTNVTQSNTLDAITCMKGTNPDATDPVWITINALQAAYDFSQT